MSMKEFKIPIIKVMNTLINSQAYVLANWEREMSKCSAE